MTEISSDFEERGGGNELLNVSNVSVHYGGVQAVSSVSFGVRRRSITGIIGPNGSGKTSLLNAMSCFVQIADGHLQIDSVDYEGWSSESVAALGIARTFQSIRLVEGLSVLENVALGADLQFGRKLGLDWWLGRRRASTYEAGSRSVALLALERCGILSLAKRDPFGLPYGTQRRVEIARAIAMSPRVLLLDEPTAGMSESEREEIAELMKTIRDNDISVVIIEHNLRMMTSLCDWLLVMNLGRIIAEGPPLETMQNPEVRTSYLGGS